MLKETYYTAPTELDELIFAKLVPADHYLRQVKVAVDFTSVRWLVAEYYSPDQGRGADDPVLLFKLCFLPRRPRIPQHTVSFYKCKAGDIPAGLAPPMAWALGVSVDELLGETEKKRRAAVGPTGRMRRLFEAASKLPRSQQEKNVAVIETFINQHSDRET
jgi:hypothetical protein